MGAYSLGCLGYVCPHETWILSATRLCTRVNVMSLWPSRPHKIYVLGPRRFIVFEAIFTVFAPATYGCVLFKYEIIGVGFLSPGKPQTNRRSHVFGVERTLFGIKQAVFWCVLHRFWSCKKSPKWHFFLMRRHVIQNPSKDGRTGASLQNTKEAPLQQEHPLLQRT